MAANFWGRYKDNPPKTHFDPLATFLDNNSPVGYRVNFLKDRGKRPREQHIKIPKTFLDEEITEEEINNSPLSKVLYGREACVPIAADDIVIGDPDGKEITQQFTEFSGLTIMNKFAPLGINSAQASGVAMVSYPTQYTRSLENPSFLYDLMLPMKVSLQYLLSGKSYRSDLNTPLVFFNVGPSSGGSIRYLHSQSYAIPEAQGLNSYGYRRAFEMYDDCLACRMANQSQIVDKINGEVNIEDLTVWEDQNVRVIYPYAPVRTMGTRIIPKHHVEYIGSVNTQLLKSLSNAISVADYLMNAASPSKRKVRKDRTISFRQTSNIDRDFHMFIDILPPFPFLAAETVDFLGLSPFRPEYIAGLMREVPIDHLELLRL